MRPAVKHTSRLLVLLLVVLAVVSCGDSGSERSEPSEAIYSVTLSDGGDSKIAVIKVIREVTGLGLRDAKEMVDSSPSIIQAGLSLDAAKAVAEKLATAGAKVELKRQ